MDEWRKRLRHAVEQTGDKHSVVAARAGVAPETLSRILTGTHSHPQFETVARIARACGVGVGWVLNERLSFTDEERRKLRNAAAIILAATGA
jgi:transcriptional regulator with XRE-family HTH domain